MSNQYSPITIVVAISSQFSNPPFPREIIIEAAEGGLLKRSAVIVNQIRSVDRLRLGNRLGMLSKQSMTRVDEAIKISLGWRSFDRYREPKRRLIPSGERKPPRGSRPDTRPISHFQRIYP